MKFTVNFNMLNQITPPASSAAESPLQMLLDCHQRIRHFCALAQKLAATENAPVAQIAQAAAELHRYFSISLPLHEADENLSLHVRLRMCAPEDKDAGDSSNAMVIQHQTIDDLVLRLLPYWERLAKDPIALAGFAPQLTEHSNRLAELMEGHLKMEEEQVFPAIARLLSAEEQEGMMAEMRSRRQTIEGSQPA